jgi:hypothetical protein
VVFQLFVYLKVLRVDSDSSILPQKALLKSELREILENRADSPRAVMVNLLKIYSLSISHFLKGM